MRRIIPIIVTHHPSLALNLLLCMYTLAFVAFGRVHTIVSSLVYFGREAIWLGWGQEARALSWVERMMGGTDELDLGNTDGWMRSPANAYRCLHTLPRYEALHPPMIMSRTSRSPHPHKRLLDQRVTGKGKRFMCSRQRAAMTLVKCG